MNHDDELKETKDKLQLTIADLVDLEIEYKKQRAELKAKGLSDAEINKRLPINPDGSIPL